MSFNLCFAFLVMYMHIYIYIYVYVYICVCIYIYTGWGAPNWFSRCGIPALRSSVLFFSHVCI